MNNKRIVKAFDCGFEICEQPIMLVDPLSQSLHCRLNIRIIAIREHVRLIAHTAIIRRLIFLLREHRLFAGEH